MPRVKSIIKKRETVIATNGYATVFLPKHHLAMTNGYVYIHRIVAEAKLKRELRSDEQVHHIDGNKLNNSLSNIEILTDREHRIKHRTRSDLRLPNEENIIIECECGCGSTFKKYDSYGRPRRFVANAGHHQRNKFCATTLAVLSALESGEKTTSFLLQSFGASAEYALTRLRQRGLVKNLRHGLWALEQK